jgi:signal transduction histidine kinase
LRELAEHLQSAREAERARIAHEIHDELGAALTAVKLNLSWYVEKGTGGRRGIDTRLEDALRVVEDAIRTVRRIATELRPSLLDNLGLTAAIEWQAAEFRKRASIRCTVDLEQIDGKVSSQVETAVFRMVQESLTNVARHAHASAVSIVGRIEEGMLRVEIADNGNGFELAQLEGSTSLGIRGMIERARMHDGEVNVVAAPGKGARVSIAFRVPRDGADGGADRVGKGPR